MVHSCARTLGVDLASAAQKTGVCVLDWANGFTQVETLEVGADDGSVLDLHRDCDAVGIDCPFGWPESFKNFLARSNGDYVPQWTAEYRDRLRFRRTDEIVRQAVNKAPLSVSSDLISVPAMRCVGLLARMGVGDFSGDGRVYEVYPAAALTIWDLPARGYKGPKGRHVRSELVEMLCEKAPWLRVDQRKKDCLLASDDAVDALVCALLARAALLGLTERPKTEDDAVLARTEGWIHLPATDCLARLGNFG